MSASGASNRGKGRKKQSKNEFVIDVNELLEEKRTFYEGLQEIERLKQEYSKESETSKLDDLDTSITHITPSLRINGDKHPGIKVFCEKSQYQCFTLEKIKKVIFPNNLTYDYLRLFLEKGVCINHIANEVVLRQLFNLMSIDDDYCVIESCYKTLVSNVSVWTPKYKHLIRLFFNWGANNDTLGIYDMYRLSFKDSSSTQVKHHLHPEQSETFLEENFKKVFEYLGVVFQHKTNLSRGEKVTVIKCLTKIALDGKCHSILYTLKNCIHECVESFNRWDEYTVTSITRLIVDKKDHFHNQVYALINVLPKTSRCNNICSCLSYALLCLITRNTLEYPFSYQDDDILKLVKSMKVNSDVDEDLYRVYVLLQLLNYMIYHRNIPTKNKILLDQLKNVLDTVKWEVAKSTKVFDAQYVKGRIMYCCTMWSLSAPDTLSF